LKNGCSWFKRCAEVDILTVAYASLYTPTMICSGAYASIFENRPTDQWPVFPVWGMYFRNVKKVDVQDVKLSVKGKEYRKAWMVDNVEKHNLNVVDVR
jgi:hypothetical protein